MAVGGDEGRAFDAVERRSAGSAPAPPSATRLEREAEALGRRRHALQLAPALLRGGKPQAADGFHSTAWPVSASIFDRARRSICISRVRLRFSAAGRRARRRARSSRGSGRLLEKDDVALAELREMVGDRAADGAAADNDDTGMGGKHANLRSGVGPSPTPLILRREPKASLEGRNPARAAILTREAGEGDPRRRWRGKPTHRAWDRPLHHASHGPPSPVAARRRRKALVRASRLAALAPQHEGICGSRAGDRQRCISPRYQSRNWATLRSRYFENGPGT